MTIGNIKEVQLSKMSKQVIHKRLSNGNLTKELKNDSVSLLKSGKVLIVFWLCRRICALHV